MLAPFFLSVVVWMFGKLMKHLCVAHPCSVRHSRLASSNLDRERVPALFSTASDWCIYIVVSLHLFAHAHSSIQLHFCTMIIFCVCHLRLKTSISKVLLSME